MPDQQQDVKAQQPVMLLPLFAGKHVADGQMSLADQALVIEDGSPSPNIPLLETGQGSACQHAKPSQPAAGSASPSRYPDTQLYQFADIELAHGH